MFTGLIEEVGRVRWIRAAGRGTQLQVAAPAIAKRLRKGDSVAVNGVCLTSAVIRGSHVTFDLLKETLARTNLGPLRPDSGVNLERALKAGGRIGGHFVQGHIDCALRVRSFVQNGADHRLEIDLPNEFSRLTAVKGSIALDGVSLTIAEILKTTLVVWIIPHTRRHTTFSTLQPRDLVNVEFDILAKYVERMLPRRSTP